MYKVLLVDDEIITLHGISNNVNWKKHDTQLIGMAKNGLEAMEIMKTNTVDIIISDIKMPGLDGLRLLEEVKKISPTIIFVILSGYSEFEFAKRAMQHGVKHYLLKPCNEEQIEQVLLNAIKDLKEQKRYESQLNTYKEEVENALPQIKQQFLKELMMNKSFTSKERRYYENLFNLRLYETQRRLVLFEIHKDYQFKTFTQLEKIVNKEFCDYDERIIGTFMQTHILFLVPSISTQELSINLNNIKQHFEKESNLILTIAFTKAHVLINMNHYYKQAKDSLKKQFYDGTGSIINSEIVKFSYSMDNIDILKSEIIFSLRSKDIPNVYKEIDLFFEKIKEVQFSIELAKTHILNLFASLARECNINFEKTVMFEEMNNLNDMKKFIKNAIIEVLDNSNSQTISKQEKLIVKVKGYVDEYLDHENLTLSWLANEVLFMNADYLGKVFKKETGEKFSQYLLRVRMEKAQEIILSSEETKVLEVAKKVGYDNYPQYFSQVFKKYTKYTPSEYKKVKEEGY